MVAETTVEIMEAVRMDIRVIVSMAPSRKADLIPMAVDLDILNDQMVTLASKIEDKLTEYRQKFNFHFEI